MNEKIGPKHTWIVVFRAGGRSSSPLCTTWNKHVLKRIQEARCVVRTQSARISQPPFPWSLTLAAWNSKLTAPPMRAVLSALSQGEARRGEERNSRDVMRRGAMARNTWLTTGYAAARRCDFHHRSFQKNDPRKDPSVHPFEWMRTQLGGEVKKKNASRKHNVRHAVGECAALRAGKRDWEWRWFVRVSATQFCFCCSLFFVPIR